MKLGVNKRDCCYCLTKSVLSKLKFDDHVMSLCLKANRNVSALSRAAKVIDPPKCKLLYNSFVMSNFRYCPLIWMFCGRTANKEINRVHKRALRISLKDFDASFDDLLIRNEEKTVHVQNLQKLMIECINRSIVKTLLSYGIYSQGKKLITI